MAFVNENFGESELAQRFGIRRYPAVFVDDVLVAKPKDFGFYGEGGSQGDGRYVPFKDPANHERFRQDLIRMVDLALAGRDDQLRAEGATSSGEREIERLPEVALADLDGNTIATRDLAGRVVVVEFWASWCPPCDATLAFLDTLERRWADDLEVLAVAVESPEEDVRRKAAAAQSPAVRWAMGTPELAASFGDVVAVPTLFVFDRSGRTVGVFYGAPPDLHEKVDALIRELAGG